MDDKQIEKIQERFPKLTELQILVGDDLLEHLAGLDVEIIHFDNSGYYERLDATLHYHNPTKHEDLEKKFHGFMWDLAIASTRPLIKVDEMNFFLNSLIPPKNYSFRDRQEFCLGRQDEQTLEIPVYGGKITLQKEIGNYKSIKNITVTDKAMARIFNVNESRKIEDIVENQGIFKTINIYAMPAPNLVNEHNYHSTTPVMDSVSREYKTEEYIRNHTQQGMGSKLKQLISSYL